MADTRARDYIAQYGNDSWELDALTPSQIVDLVEDSILSVLDISRFNTRHDLQTQGRGELKVLLDNYDGIKLIYMSERMGKVGDQ